MKHSASIKKATLTILASAVVAACGSGDPVQEILPPGSIKVLSSRADTVSGGNAVIEFETHQTVSNGSLFLLVNDREQALDAVAHESLRLRALIKDLEFGANDIKVVDRKTGQVVSQGVLKNHPAEGPVFSGAHQRPWLCETEASGLGPAPVTGACTADTKTEWFYRNTAGDFKPWVPGVKPSDLAATTTITGDVVDFIVRVESGVINESIYRIAILDNPETPIREPWATDGQRPGSGWNGKLYWAFEGGASPGNRSGRNTVTYALQSIPLSLGFAVASSTRNVYGTGSDDLVSAETLSMVKEHFIENYGMPIYTVGLGSSGGAIQQHLIAQNYPGLLDGLIANVPYPDGVSIAVDVIDCHLLQNYFSKVADVAVWPDARRAVVDGYPITSSGANVGMTVCQTGWSGLAEAWQDASGKVDRRGFDSVIPAEWRYDAISNPTGVRGTIWDSNVMGIGRDPITGFARSVYDNIGVQYGLVALNDGSISIDEFLDINEKIGGRDVDGNWVPNRVQGDLIGIANAYKSGRVLWGDLALPIIHLRNYRDHLNDIHTMERSYAVLDRLKSVNGHSNNVVSWTFPFEKNYNQEALLAQDSWQESIRLDTSSKSFSEKVIANKPTSLKDGCWDQSGDRFDAEFDIDAINQCSQLYPASKNTRMVAGGPLNGSILKCQLSPVDPTAYSVNFTNAQLERLHAVFPAGVCDWEQPGVNQMPPEGPWLHYTSAGVWSKMVD